MRKCIGVTAMIVMNMPGLALAVTADIYQSMASGSDGDVLNQTMMDASSFGGAPGVATEWLPYHGTMWFSREHVRDLPGVVTIGGVDHDGHGLGTWKVNARLGENLVAVRFGTGTFVYSGGESVTPLRERITVACYYTMGALTNHANAYYLDTIVVGNPGQTWSVLQLYQTGSSGLTVRAHGSLEDPQASAGIPIAPEKTYWVNLHHDGVGGQSQVAVYDPEGGFAPVGMESVGTKVGGVMSWVKIGRKDNHADYVTEDVYAHFSHVLIDYTAAEFPLLPDGVCRDGDRDGYLSAECGGSDCNDADAQVYPGHGCGDAPDSGAMVDAGPEEGPVPGLDAGSGSASKGCSCHVGGRRGTWASLLLLVALASLVGGRQRHPR